MQDFGPWGLYPNMNHYILYSVTLDAPLWTTEVPKLPWRILTQATTNISQTFTWYLESEQSKKMSVQPSITTPVSHRTWKTSLPLSTIKQKQRGSCVWKGGSGRVSSTDREKHPVAGKGKAVLHCSVISDEIQCVLETNCVLLGSAHTSVWNLQLTKTSCHTLISSTFLPWSGLNTILTCGRFNVEVIRSCRNCFFFQQCSHC